MRINTNNWNKIRYTVHSLYYDLMMVVFKGERKKAINLLSVGDDEKVLIVGAGTGSDLPYLSPKSLITATDITPAMLSKLKAKAKRYGMNVQATVMDGQQLDFDDESFDCVILNLILAVIPDPERCIKEAERVLKPNGRIIVFDKFMKEKNKAGILRKAINGISNILFSEINRKFKDIVSVTKLRTEKSIKSLGDGFFMIYLLRKD